MPSIISEEFARQDLYRCKMPHPTHHCGFRVRFCSRKMWTFGVAAKSKMETCSWRLRLYQEWSETSCLTRQRISDPTSCRFFEPRRRML